MCKPLKNDDKVLPAGSDTAAGVASDNNVNNSSSLPSFHLVATAAPEEDRPKKILDTSELDEQDLEALKKQDPFLYYSIPAVWQADIIHNSDVDIRAIRGSGSQTSRRASAPGRMQSDESSTKVERKTRISFECHMDVLLEDLMDEFDDSFLQEFPEGAGLDFEDLIFQQFSKKNAKQ